MFLAFSLFMTWLLQTAWLLLLFTHLFPVAAIPWVKDSAVNEDVQPELYCRRAEWAPRGSTEVRGQRTRSTEVPSSASDTLSPHHPHRKRRPPPLNEHYKSHSSCICTQGNAELSCGLWHPEMKSLLRKPKFAAFCWSRERGWEWGASLESSTAAAGDGVGLCSCQGQAVPRAGHCPWGWIFSPLYSAGAGADHGFCVQGQTLPFRCICTHFPALVLSLCAVGL